MVDISTYRPERVKTWEFRGVFKEDCEGDVEGYFKESSRGCLRGTWMLEGDLKGN